MTRNLNILELLQGTKYASKADFIALKIKSAGLDNDRDIHELPRLGQVAGEDVFALLATILQQDRAAGVAMTPAAKALIEDAGADPVSIPASGKGGKVTKSDVEAYLSNSEEIT